MNVILYIVLVQHEKKNIRKGHQTSHRQPVKLIEYHISC